MAPGIGLHLLVLFDEKRDATLKSGRRPQEALLSVKLFEGDFQRALVAADVD